MSLFNRPAWAIAQASDLDESEQNIFSHSRAYQGIVAEEQRKKQERLDRHKAKQERRNSDKYGVKEDRDSGSSKRRRITLEEGAELLKEVGLSAGPTELLDKGRTQKEGERSAPSKRTSPRFKRQMDRDDCSLQKRQTPVIDLGDSEGEGRTQPNDGPVSDEPQEESDNEIAELVRQARAQRQMKEQQTIDAPSPSADFNASTFEQSAPPKSLLFDPTIQLFISSRIPNTKPLIVHRKLSQRLQEIREVWCSKQGFSEEFSKEVFFIHRMRRLYNVTTCRSLGLDVDAEGNVTMKGAEGKEGVDKIHLEAVTDEIFAKLRAEKKRGQVEEGNAQSNVEPQAHTKEESLIRVLFKAKGNPEPFKLRVKPTTVVSKVVMACRNHFKMAETESCFLEFDGERLNPDSLVQDTEISDMDVVDVHIA